MDIDYKFEEELSIIERQLDRASDPVHIVLILLLYIEHLLDRYIKTKLIKDTGLLGGKGLGFSNKVKLASSFGELDEQLIDSFKKINDIRNDCAHEFGYEIPESKVQVLGRTLGKNYKEILKDNPNAVGYCIAPIAPIAAFVSGRILCKVLESEGFK